MPQPFWRTDACTLPMWVIYERPRDFPNSFVVRLWDMDRPTAQFCVGPSLDVVRDLIPPGATQLSRHPMDEPQIVEVWL